MDPGPGAGLSGLSDPIDSGLLMEKECKCRNILSPTKSAWRLKITWLAPIVFFSTLIKT